MTLDTAEDEYGQAPNQQHVRATEHTKLLGQREHDSLYRTLSVRFALLHKAT